MCEWIEALCAEALAQCRAFELARAERHQLLALLLIRQADDDDFEFGIVDDLFERRFHRAKPHHLAADLREARIAILDEQEAVGVEIALVAGDIPALAIEIAQHL